MLSAVGVEGLAPDGEDIAFTLTNGQQLCAHAAIVATGSTYRRLGVPGEEDLIGAGVHFCATCDGPFYRGADEILLIGGGNSGLEEGLFLAQLRPRSRRRRTTGVGAGRSDDGRVWRPANESPARTAAHAPQAQTAEIRRHQACGLSASDAVAWRGRLERGSRAVATGAEARAAGACFAATRRGVAP